MKVGMLLDWFFPYAAGVANALADEARVIMVVRDHGYEIGVTHDATTAMGGMLDERIRLLALGGRQRDPRSVNDVCRVVRLMERNPPDVLHIQDHTDWRLYALQRLLPQVPSLLTIHDVVYHEGEKQGEGLSLPIKRRLRHSVRTHPDAYVVHGHHLADQLRAQDWYGGQAIHVIPHGRLPYPAGVASLPSTPTILFFGRLEYYKGLDLLVQAAEIASESVPDLRVIVAGDGPEDVRCRRLVRLQELFDWRTGFVPYEETADLFAEASVVVLPYRDASQSGVVPMAFANGRPVIATDVGALSEVVRDGENGLLVGSVSSAALAAAIVRVFCERDLLDRLREGAIATITTGTLSPRNIARLHLRAYAEVARASSK